MSFKWAVWAIPIFSHNTFGADVLDVCGLVVAHIKVLNNRVTKEDMRKIGNGSYNNTAT